MGAPMDFSHRTARALSASPDRTIVDAVAVSGMWEVGRAWPTDETEVRVVDG